MAGFFVKNANGTLSELALVGRYVGRDGSNNALYDDFSGESQGDPGPVDPDPVPDTTMLMGCSDSPNNHGGTEQWDCWRVYDWTKMLARANQTGSLRPKALAYSEDFGGSGQNLGGANPNYNTVYQGVLDDLNTFYYGSTSNTTLTQHARWGISLYWSNGNENQDKGALSRSGPEVPLTQTQVNNYVISQKALYDAIHYTYPIGHALQGQRRFPDAYAGSNPVHEAEMVGGIEQYLHPSAQYHDFVMWSMYPPGRQSTVDDPTYNFPSFFEADRLNRQLGFMIRCFYRTKQALLQARIDTNNPNRQMSIAIGEIGTGRDPDDKNTRPYYAVYGLAHGALKLSEQYSLPIPFACWWDNSKDASSPQNILTDEDATANPSTTTAWKNHLSYNTYRGGTKPAAWLSPATPRSTWKTTGTPL